MPEESEITVYGTDSNGRVEFRGSLNSTGTQTGRVSSTIPNTYNISQESLDVLEERRERTANLIARWEEAVIGNRNLQNNTNSFENTARALANYYSNSIITPPTTREELGVSWPMQVPESPIFYIKWNYTKRRRLYSWFRNKWWTFRCDIGEIFQSLGIKSKSLKATLDKKYLYYSRVIKQSFKYKVKTKEEFF